MTLRRKSLLLEAVGDEHLRRLERSYAADPADEKTKAGLIREYERRGMPQKAYQLRHSHLHDHVVKHAKAVSDWIAARDALDQGHKLGREGTELFRRKWDAHQAKNDAGVELLSGIRREYIYQRNVGKLSRDQHPADFQRDMMSKLHAREHYPDDKTHRRALAYLSGVYGAAPRREIYNATNRKAFKRFSDALEFHGHDGELQHTKWSTSQQWDQPAMKYASRDV